jgi:hypothetical protein
MFVWKDILARVFTYDFQMTYFEIQIISFS